MNNLHISSNNLSHGSRVLKEAKSLVSNEIFDSVFLAALHDNGLNKKEVINERIQINRFTLTTRNLSKSLISQALKYLEFCFKITLHYKGENIKVINIHSLDLLPLGVFLKFYYNALLVYDAHELETEKNGLFGIRKKISKVIEKRLIKYTDMTIVVSESISDWYANEYDISKPIVILNTPIAHKLKSNNLFRESLNIREDQIILLYQGGLFTGRGIELILDTFKKRSSDKVVVIFMGYGPLEKEIKCAAESFSNIFFFPAVPPETVLNYTSSADIGISIIENVCLSYYYCLPNKLFEYSMAGLPVIVSNMKEMSNLVTKYNIGLVLKELTAKDLNAALDILSKSDLSIMKKNAYATAIKNAWEVQEEKMVHSYKELLKYTSRSI